MEPTEINAVFQSAGTAVLADIFDQLGIEPPVLDNSLLPVAAGNVFVGPAYTVAGENRVYAGSDHKKLEAIDNMTQGVVAIWAGTDAEGVCCFGDLLAAAMRARGVVAAVVDGGVRDVAFLRGCGMPVLSRYRTPAQGVGRWKVTAYQVPVQVRGALRKWVTITPGDLVLADEDGVIVVSADMASTVAIEASKLLLKESGARKEILQGMPLLEALSRFGSL